MKLNISYSKLSLGTIEAQIEAVDAGDYVTVNVFVDDNDYPDSETFVFGSSSQPSICFRSCDILEIQRWIKAETEALTKHLAAWRKIELPDNYNIEI